VRAIAQTDFISLHIAMDPHTLEREYGTLVQPHLEIDAKGWGHFDDPPGQIGQLLALPNWNEDVTDAVSEFRRCGRQLSTLVSADQPPWDAIFPLLEIKPLNSDWKQWSGASEFAAARNELIAAHKRMVIGELQLDQPLDFDAKFDPRQIAKWDDIFRCVRNGLEKIDWEKRADDLAGDLDVARAALSAVAAESSGGIKVRGGNNEPWLCASVFLGIWFTLNRQRQEARKSPGGGLGFDKGRLDRFFFGWLPELDPTRFRSGPSTTRLKSTSPLDKLLTMDNDFRVSRPGSGTTRKPGSHRDNRGHN
jgi:hypothetical protein